MPVNEQSASIVELDELHTYLLSKKTTLGYGLLLIDLQNGLSLLSTETAPQRQG
ncbi:hypothetical protein BN938_0630 [Mucinivorans hirudinis]|uniref:Uncharacterized protein n=1 Tax=Mucinivorans hirudinis TaxID=1433126 RepID=A0A060R6Q5_9BACT|nr:hypothetical protein BN938_0630 [Mucinivorans hirudinis]